MKNDFDMIIIGGGPAGYTAALYAARAGIDALLIERMAAGGQMTLTGDIENYPGFEAGIDGFSLGVKMQKSAEKFGAKTHYASVLAIDFSKGIKTVFTDNGNFTAKTVIIASGANSRELGLEGEEDLLGRGVHYCAHCDGRFYKDKTVVVVGGGNSAVSDALYLSNLAKKVYLVHRRDTLRADRIYHAPIKNTPNIEILWDSAVVKFNAEDRLSGVAVRNLKTDETANIECDGVFVSIGRKPITDFLGGSLELDQNGYIKADETTKTNIDGVYAVGDVRAKPLRQIVTAVSDGAVAVHFAQEYLFGS